MFYVNEDTFAPVANNFPEDFLVLELGCICTILATRNVYVQVWYCVILMFTLLHLRLPAPFTDYWNLEILDFQSQMLVNTPTFIEMYADYGCNNPSLLRISI
ncbi:hypothetical protein TNCT_365921 [Trichonephila clavata]|uniref:Uncharacterized protein n=1 Tax=Trichonephila clavata TaxID=2740835 RepID=A0A8X6FL29_TRICU|nr:hypothetical protein TNCT_365921 [Trichonephila clavata]